MSKLIEAGHYYSCVGPSNVSMKGWEIGRSLAGKTGASLAVFVDDYHSEQGFVEDGEVFLGGDKAQTVQNEAEYVFFESEIAKTVPQLTTELLENSKIKLKKNVLSSNGVRLGCLR